MEEEHKESLERIKNIIKSLEEKYGITSKEFMELWKNDKIEDTFETNKWSILLFSIEGYDGDTVQNKRR